MKNDNEDLDDPIIIQMEKYGTLENTTDIEIWREDYEFWRKSEKKI